MVSELRIHKVIHQLITTVRILQIFMLRLDHIKLTHYKNYLFREFHFPGNVVGISGLNGIGKTNLLDAIYYCCFTKSYFSSSDLQNIRHQTDGFRLQAFFEREGKPEEVICIHRGSTKKEFSLNGVPYAKYSKHIGLLPVVMIAPDDVELISGSSETRRKFIDTVLSQVDADYLQHLIYYNKILLQRNSHLKNADAHQQNAKMVLEVLNEQMIQPATIIYEKRKQFLLELIPLVNSFYEMICGGTEKIELEYVSQLHDKNMQQLLSDNYQQDIYLQRTSGGIHKDDIVFKLNESVFKQVASQGQRKSLLFALKLGEYEIIRKYTGFAPILLLDDVFEKLDAKRMQRLLGWVCAHNNGQVFITDTHTSRLEQSFTELGIQATLINL